MPPRPVFTALPRGGPSRRALSTEGGGAIVLDRRTLWLDIRALVDVTFLLCVTFLMMILIKEVGFVQQRLTVVDTK